MKRKMRKYRDYLIEELADREKAISYLQTALEEYQRDGDTAAFLLALRHADPQDLLRVLSSEDGMQIDTIGTVLNGLGCRLSIELLEVPIPNRDAATH